MAKLTQKQEKSLAGILSQLAAASTFMKDEKLAVCEKRSIHNTALTPCHYTRESDSLCMVERGKSGTILNRLPFAILELERFIANNTKEKADAS